MTPKRRRLTFVIVAGIGLAAAAALILTALEDSVVFFKSPTEIAAESPAPEQRLRVGGLVKEGSIAKEADGLTTTFTITDLESDLRATYTGVLPDLFSEGEGVVAEGVLGPDGVFRAETVLAKHDETYMPPEVADAIKKSGQWKGEE